MSKRWVTLACWTTLALCLATGGGAAKAACVADRPIFAPYSYIYTPGIANGYLDSTVTASFSGSFWALGEGHPAGQAGVDNGKFRAVDGNFDGWLTILPRVGRFGYPPAIDSSWSASPVIDGCIDTTGSDPVEADLQQCIVMMLGDQNAGAGFFAIASAPATLSGGYDLTVPGDQPIVLAEVPRPTSDFDPYMDDSTNAITIAAPLLDGSGQYVNRDCPDVITGYRVYRQILPTGSAAPVDRTRDDGDGVGWEVARGGQLPSGLPLPLTQPAELTFRCTQRSDVYLAFALAFDSGFETPYLSRNHLHFAIDCCTDADGDGVCAEPGESRAHDCDDSNASCSIDCTDADADLHCVPGDCDDANPAIHGNVAEVCDGIDNNCDGRRDETPVALGGVTSTGVVGGSSFGLSAAALGDVNNDGYGDFVIAAIGDTASGVLEAGSATVYSGRTRSPIQRLRHPDPQPGDRFGSAVVRIGDVNVDGIDDILIGADGDDTVGGIDAGSAFVFSGSAADAFELLHVLEDPAGAGGHGFGAAVAALGDHNADDVRDVAVGTPGAEGDRGRVLVFSGAGGNLIRTVTDPASQPGDRFGCAIGGIGGIGDLNAGGGSELLAASCSGDSPVAAGSGVVTIVAGNNWLPLLTVFDPLGQSGDGFGGSVTRIDDVDGDGVDDLLVGASDVDDPLAGADAGGTLLFSGVDASLLRRFVNIDAEAADRFGNRVAGLGDLDGDGIADIGVSAPTDDGPAGVDTGSVVLFSGATGNPIVKLEAATPAPGEGFGSALVSLGDLDDDGVADLLVGAATADSVDGTGTGNAIVFSGARGLDADRDGTGDRCDCAPLDPTAQVHPGETSNLVLVAGPPTLLTWLVPGAGYAFDVAGGLLSDLRPDGGVAQAECFINDAPGPQAQDNRIDPPSGDGYYYLPRARNACGSGSFGLDSAGLERQAAGCP